MKKIFTTLFLFCFIFSYVFCMPSLAYTYQNQPVLLNENIIALNEMSTSSSTQLYQNVNGVFVPVNTTQINPNQYQQSTQYQQTVQTTVPAAPVIVQPIPQQQVYTQTTTVTETVIEEEPSKGEKIAAAVFGTVLVGGLITLLALTSDGPDHHAHHGKPSKHHKPHRR